jgi:endonuclease/exonuclease/phosphatase (EEP) superfamily protein YafD
MSRRALHRCCPIFSVAAALCACGPEVLEPRDPTPGVPHFKVATYNIWSEKPGDAGTLDAIGGTHAGIIALEEVTHDWLEPVRERFSAEYPYMLFEPTSGASGLGVISKYPLTASELQFVNNWHPAWRVEAQTPAGWLQLLIVHLRSNFTGRDDPVEAYVNVSDDHLLQTKDYVEHTVRDVPTVILGDFNESPEGSSVRYLEKIGYENALPLYHPGQYTWRQASLGGQFDQTIDHILFNDFLAPLNAYVLDRGGSDHLPVIAHFEASRPWPELSLTPDQSEAIEIAD